MKTTTCDICGKPAKDHDPSLSANIDVTTRDGETDSVAVNLLSGGTMSQIDICETCFVKAAAPWLMSLIRKTES